MTVQEIYDRYRIMPGLQLHQLRVAGVAKMIDENLVTDIDTESVVLACLFHDMGNIIKSDLDVLPELLEPLGKAHWQLVKNGFIEQYGNNEHNATLHIAKECGLPPRVVALIEGIGFSKLEHTRDTPDFEMKVVEYGDLRVGPHGVVSMAARLDEARQRYAHRMEAKHDIASPEAQYEHLRGAAFEIELQLFQSAAIVPEDITEHAVQPYFDELRSMTVAC